MIGRTKYLGEIKFEQNKIIQFPSGLPGFVDETEFILLDLPGNAAFQTLQSIRTSNLAFIVTNPYQFYKNYAFDLDDNVLESLQIKSVQDVVVLVIVTLKSPFDTSTLNLKAPLIINSTLKQGKQYILNRDDYLTKAFIAPPESIKVKGD